MAFEVNMQKYNKYGVLTNRKAMLLTFTWLLKINVRLYYHIPLCNYLITPL